ncbi:molybdopterin-containing oxidoreductase family protein [Cytobacillus gottheilii]|uniref:Molybdopterin oxidoreductase family protein n=1 Tax=Cytobacillus gottheilii TaxID=859144 RepID=A0ABX8F759_9BACI|nr:molybdopterin oxidoreductase family protein [Cytobacillus gottheilii]QVY59944.1 molybdopterin oxidoreductase family protein [Cytobacillus gottheilii]
MPSYIDQENGVFPSVCSLDCPDQCGLLVHKKDGKITKIEGDPNHPVTQGSICNKVRHMTHRLYDENRLQYPLKRIGKKGEGKFARISWEEAISEITSRWKKLIEDHGSESILPYSFYGNMGIITSEGMDRRFFNALGSSQLDRKICQSAGTKGYSYTMGGNIGVDPEDTIHAKLIIFWGINAVSTNMHQVMLAQKARKNGAKIVVIDVHKNQTGRLADWFIPIKPGTDGMLALGLMHILFKENLVDEAFMQEHTTGHEQLRKHVRQYTPEQTAEITGVSLEDLYELAELYATSASAFIRIGNGLQHHDNGGMATRAISCLPAVTGQWAKKGGGAIKSNSGFLSHNEDQLQRPDLLTNKNTRVINMNQIGVALLQTDDPVRSMFVYNSNPAVVAPSANKVREGLQRDDLFLVVHDLFLTETAKMADIVLPATSSYENTDFLASYWHHYVQLQQPVIEPFGEAKSNTDVFRLLAAEMGITNEAFSATDEELIQMSLNYEENPYISHITFEGLKEHQFMKADLNLSLLENLPTASGKIELYSEKMIEDGYDPLPVYVPIKPDGDYEFMFIPGPNHNFLNSTFSNNDKHQKLEKEPKVHLNSADAGRLHIEDGEMVKVWNDRGMCELKAAVGETVLPGVAVTQGLWSDQDGKIQLVNALTPDRLSDMGDGATFFSGRVNVSKIV